MKYIPIRGINRDIFLEKIVYKELNKKRSNKKRSRKKIIPRYKIREVYDIFCDEVAAGLVRDRLVRIQHWGTFKLTLGEKIVKFKFAKALRDRINNAPKRW